MKILSLLICAFALTSCAWLNEPVDDAGKPDVTTPIGDVAATEPAPTAPQPIDLNNDGKPDVVVTPPTSQPETKTKGDALLETASGVVGSVTGNPALAFGALALGKLLLELTKKRKVA